MSQPEADLMSPQRELDLRSLILLVWAMRLPLLFAFVLVTVGYWAYVVTNSSGPATPTYSRVLQFSFHGVEDGRYPNGSPFHIGDLVTPGLISALYELHRLDERGVARATFSSAFAIEPYSPERGYILTRLDQLAQRGTPAELVVLLHDFTEELRRAGSGAARLWFRPLVPLALADGDVGKLLLDLPRLWAKDATELYGVLGPDVPVYSPALFDQAETEKLEYTAALEAMRRKGTAFLDTVHAAMAVPHANSVRDPQSGASLLDVQDAVYGLMDRVQRLSADVAQLRLAKDRTALTRQYEHRVATLVRTADIASDRFSTMQTALVELVGSSTDIAESSLAGELPTATLAAQQSRRAGALIDALLEREAEAARLRLELARDRATLDTLRQQGNAEVPKLSPPIDARLADVVTALQQQAGVAQRIHALLSRDNFAVERGLYQIVDGGLMVDRPPILRPRDVYVYVSLLFAVATVVVVVGGAFRPRQSGAGV